MSSTTTLNTATAHSSIHAPTWAAARKIATIARVGLGIVFTVFGFNGFLHFLPPPEMAGSPAQFFGALVATGYMLPLVMGTQLVGGLLLLSNRFVPLALTLLAPVIVNILAFHIALVKAGYAMPLLLLSAELYLAWAHRGAFAAILRAHSVPNMKGTGAD